MRVVFIFLRGWCVFIGLRAETVLKQWHNQDTALTFNSRGWAWHWTICLEPESSWGFSVHRLSEVTQIHSGGFFNPGRCVRADAFWAVVWQRRRSFIIHRRWLCMCIMCTHVPVSCQHPTVQERFMCEAWACGCTVSTLPDTSWPVVSLRQAATGFCQGQTAGVVLTSSVMSPLWNSNTCDNLEDRSVTRWALVRMSLGTNEGRMCAQMDRQGKWRDGVSVTLL